MSEIDNQLIASYAQQIGTPANGAALESGMEPEGNATQENSQAAGNETSTSGMEGVAKEPLANEQPVPAVTQPDYNKYIEEVTSGAFKNADELKASLGKLSGFDQLKQERDELEAKTKVDPYFSPVAKKIDELYRNGASQDQIENFHKINKVGDIASLPPLEAKLAKMVLVDGWRESVAKLQISQEFPLEDYEEGTPEKLVMEEKLRLSAESDKKALEAFKVDAIQPTVVNTAEEQRLQQVAKQQQHDTYVKANVPAIAANIQGMGELSFKPEEGDPVNMRFDYPPEFKAQMGDKLFEYFSDGQTPINEATVSQAFKAINATYLDDNFPAIAQRVFEQGYSLANERATNRYENRSGLPKSAEVRAFGTNTEVDYGNFLKGLVTSN